MFRRFSGICIVVFLFGLTLFAQNPDTKQKPTAESLPPVVVSGFEAYKQKGPEEAIRTWLKGSPLEDSKDALGQANNLRMIENYYGHFQTYDVVNSKTISPKVKVFYLVINFDKGPVFAKLMLYRSGEQWITTAFDFNTKPEVILP